MPSLLIMKIHDSSFPFQKQIREFSDITLQSYRETGRPSALQMLTGFSKKIM